MSNRKSVSSIINTDKEETEYLTGYNSICNFNLTMYLVV